MPSNIYSVPCLSPTRSNILLLPLNSNWKKVFNHRDLFCNKVNHVCLGQIQQKLSDKRVCAQDHECFFGYAASGKKKMNSNQKDLYLFTPSPVVPPVCGAADGDPKIPSFHKPAWSIKLAGNELFDLRPWLYTQLYLVKDAFVVHPFFQGKEGFLSFSASLLSFGNEETNFPSCQNICLITP
jgi:hypothetical protein